MPDLYIMSVFDRQKAKYGDAINRAREELARYADGLGSLVGTEVAALVRQYVDIPWASLLNGGRLPIVPPEGQAALAEVQRLTRQETSISRKLYTPLSCYSEPYGYFTVFWSFNYSWEDIEMWWMQDGCLSVENVRWLLELMRDTEMGLPTRKDVEAYRHRCYDKARTCGEWRRVLKRNRRRLVRFLWLASKLNEDVQCLL